ncbi:VCBS domain-containing protein [Novosphingobium bradum]|uniref:VCBS domain-containing protein n=1 Tax=Novosphingobium bradum TaxID=1737444 RepID=A0ABV7IU38_9SPHN
MPIPNTRVFLNSVLSGNLGIRFSPAAFGDFASLAPGHPVAPWLGSTADLNGDGKADLILGASASDVNGLDSGRVFVTLGGLATGTTTALGASAQLIIDGAAAGDHAGTAVAGLADMTGDGRGEILIGAPGVDVAGATDAGSAYVVFGRGAGEISLVAIDAGLGGFAIRGEAAGDAAGSSVLSVGDLNGDGRADFLVGAPGNDAAALDAGAAYVVWGKDTTAPVNLADVASGIGGFKIIGGAAGDLAGTWLGTVGDMNGDGLNEILIGSPNTGSGKDKGGAVFVVFGKATGTAVDLKALGSNGFAINGIRGDSKTGARGDNMGDAVSGIGDVNGDGRADLLIGAPTAGHAYVVFGKAGTGSIDAAQVKAGLGGFEIVPEAAKDLDQLSVTGGRDLNRDGIADFVIGAPSASTNGTTTGAVYVVWGGGTGKVDLALVAQGIGGAKISGTPDSLTGSSVVIVDDQNGDGVVDLLIGSPGLGESATLLYSPASWQPDNTVYGTEGADLIGAGTRSGVHAVGPDADNIMALGGNDTISTGAGDDTLDGGAGADSMAGGLGNDSYYVDNALDVVNEAAGEGIDTVYTAISTTLGANVENLTLLNGGLTGTGNVLANVLTGSTGADTLDGGAGADTMAGGLGNDTYRLDQAGDVVSEAPGGGTDTVIASVSTTLGANVENLTLAVAGLTGTGNELGNVLTGSAGADTLDGAAGADTLSGGAGNDTYHVDDAGDRVIEGAGGGTDTVIASVDHALAAEVENLVLTGSAHLGTGNGLANTITGTDGADTLDGAAGADTLAGGLGDDTYHVDNAGDVVVEAANGGTDTVIASFDYALTEGSTIENLALSGAAHHATGNSGDNVLTGGAGNDLLDGAGGLDTLIGGDGNDTFVVNSHTDTIVETAAGGTDTVLSSVDFSLAGIANVENLALTGDAHHGQGNDGANLLLGNAGADLLEGGLGNDSLDGGAGADTMDGGAGDDTYFIDNPGDVVVEAADGGTDTVVVATDWVLADNIENVKLSGTGHTLVGNAANNTLTGDTGNDVLDGGAGDDIELGGDGNDVLHSSSGLDTLAGGSGDDVYRIHGGSAHIEDFQGHDTIDASEATGNSYIDLSGETATRIEGHSVDYGTGGVVTGALNVQFLQDLTGSFADDIANVRSLVPQIVAALDGISGGAAFGVSSFRDKIWGSFGSGGDYTYKTDLAVGATATTLTTAYAGFIATGGADLPESQLEALLQLAARAGGEVGYQTNSARFAVLFTDAPFHTAADGAAQGITTANNGNAIINDGGIMENYPEIAQLAAAMAAANIIPVFAVTPGLEATYQALADAMGRGTVVTLTANSSNIVSAITTGLTTATTTHIADAIGGAGDDVIKGNIGDNDLTGNAGNDTLAGGAGNDHLHGGEGEDTAVFAGPISAYAITHNADGTITVSGNGEGSDTLDGIEVLRFGAETYTLNGTPLSGMNAAPAITSDGGAATASLSLVEGALAVTTVTGADPDPSTVLTYAITGGADAALFAIDPATGALAFRAAPSFAAPGDAGADNVYDVVVSASDGLLGASQALAITVTNANDAPVLSGTPAVLANGAEDAACIVAATDLLAGYTDPEGAALSVSALAADHATVTDNGDGTFTLTPQANYNGPLVLSYTVSDGAGGVIAATASLTLAPVNDAATIAGDLAGAVLESGGTASGLLAVADVDAGEAAFAAPAAAALAGTYGAFTIDAATGAWTYAVDSARAATQALDPGQQVSDTLTVTSLDGTASETIAVTITGTSSLAAISGEVAGAVAAEAAAFAGGRLLVSDADAGEAHFAAVDPAALAGAFGAFTFDPATGAWTFALDGAAVETVALAAGEQASQALTVTSADGSASETIVVTVTGANEVATIAGTAAGAVTEAGGLGNALVGTPSASGVLSVADPDHGEAAFAAPASLAGTYGSFAFDAATGAWAYTLDNARAATQALGAGATASDGLTVTSLDGSAAQAITVTIAGANDAAVITGTARGAVAEDSTALVTGQLAASDPDAGEARFAAPASLAGTYGSFAFDAASGAWTYALDNARAATQALAAGQTVTETLAVQSFDGSAAQAITVAVSGSNDAALIGGTTTASVTEAATAGGVSQVSGALTISDIDSPASFAGGTYAGTYGALALTTGGAWTYTLDNANLAVDALATGQGLTDSVVIRAADGTTRAITIGIVGSDEVVVGNLTLTGTAGADTIGGGAGNDQLIGLGGNDRLLGNDGNDTLDGGAGDDVLDGGAGSDTASYASATGAVTVSLAVTGLQSTGGAGKDTLVGIENLTGSASADSLTGSAGANVIGGGAGDDRITGGLGADLLTGGAGRDSFVYLATAESGAAVHDTITDFAHLADRIDLSAIDPVLSTNKNDVFLWGGSSAQSFGVWFGYDAASNVTHVFGDTDGNTATAELWIDLAGNVALTQADFVL